MSPTGTDRLSVAKPPRGAERLVDRPRRVVLVAFGFPVVAAAYVWLLPQFAGRLPLSDWLGIVLALGVGFVPVHLIRRPGWVVAVVGALLVSTAYGPGPGCPSGSVYTEGICGTTPGAVPAFFIIVAVVGGLGAAVLRRMLRGR